MFGSDNNKPLLLPIIYDLANLIREGFTRADKYKENEKQNRHQFLRRSFNTQQNQNQPIKEIDFSAPVSYLRDDSMQVEIGEPIVRNIEHIDSIKAEPLIQVLNKNFTRNTSFPYVKPVESNLTMEEIENMALKDLNGTFFEEGIRDINGSEITPMPLISRHRKRPNFAAAAKKQSGPVPETCERFTGKIEITLL